METSINKYSIAFISPGNNLLHRVISAPGESEALTIFFKEINLASYSQDEEGFSYFEEDFKLGDRPPGSIIKL